MLSTQISWSIILHIIIELNSICIKSRYFAFCSDSNSGSYHLGGNTDSYRNYTPENWEQHSRSYSFVSRSASPSFSSDGGTNERKNLTILRRNNTLFALKVIPIYFLSSKKVNGRIEIENEQIYSE